jgi:magnesium chelatase subunit D
MPDGSRIEGLTRPPADIWEEAGLAAALLAVDPVGLGGAMLRARPGPARDRWLGDYLTLIGDRPAPLRMPPSIGDERLLGGLDLSATLTAGRPVHQPGLLEMANQRGLVLPMAERAGIGLAARIGAAWDGPWPSYLIGLDEGAAPEETPPAALMDRLAFRPVLDGLAMADLAPCAFTAEEVADARARLPDVHVPNEVAEALVATAAALGIPSLRAPLLAIQAARAATALLESETAGEIEARLATQLVLAWRARQMPEHAEEDTPNDTAEDTPPPPDAETPPQDDPNPDTETPADADIPPDMLLEAARAVLPPDLLAQLLSGHSRATSQGSAGAGEESVSLRRGRPLASRPGRLGGEARLDLIATLRAAAPWQPLRRRQTGKPGLLIRPDDFRIRRFRRTKESALIFVVDASGSSAMARLAEAKGAVELMLADAYKRREQVGLIAFRGEGADVILPLTKSLVQAKRRLGGLPGGGGTPLASGLLLGAEMALSARRAGLTPFLAVLTDGRANIGRDGQPGRPQAMEDATAAARALRATGIPAVLIDTANRPQRSAETLSAEMGARYVALPRAGAQELSALVQNVSKDGAP